MSPVDFAKWLAILIPPFVLDGLFPLGLRYNFRNDIDRHPALNPDGRLTATQLMRKYSHLLFTLVITYTLFIESFLAIVEPISGPWRERQQLIAVIGIFITVVAIILRIDAL